jgi:hypothetical protein
VPLAGVTESQAGAVWSAVAVQVSVPAPPFEIAMVLDVGLEPPWVALKEREAGLRVMVGEDSVTVRVTFTV